MSFLHGVLESVKNDDNVTTYDKDNDFKNLPSSISKLMHKGSHGFSQAIAQVSDALGAWSGELEERTERAKKLFKNLINDNCVHINHSLNALKSLEGDSLSEVPEKLEACFGQADQLHKSFVLAKAAYSKLDGTLRDRLRDYVRRVELEVVRFHAAATNTELREVVLCSHRELKSLASSVKAIVDDRINTMENDIHEKFYKHIHEPIKTVSKELTEYVQILEIWVEQAQGLLTESLQMVGDIIKLVGDEKGKCPEKIRTAAEKLRKDAVALHKAMTTAHGYIQQQVKETTRAVNEELQNAVITDLQKLRDAIKKTVGRYVTKLGGQITSELGKITKQIVDASDDSASLGKIVKQAGSYAQNFPATHTSPIEEWIAGILKKDPVNRFIENYVFGVKEIEKRLRGKVSTSPNRDDIEAKVIEIVKTQINARLTNVPAQKPSINTGTVDGKLKEIATYLSTYAVGVRVLRHSEDEIIQAIEQQLEKVAEWSLEKPSESKYQAYLRYAVATTLFLLAAIANQAGAHISKLVEGSELGKINEAIKVITNIGNSLETALINGADPAAKDFKSKLQSLAEKYIEETYGGEKELIRHVNGSTASYRKKVLSVTALLKDMQDNDNGLEKLKALMTGRPIERIAGKDPTYKNGLSQKLEKLKGFIDNSLFGDPNKSVRAIKERIDNLNNSIVIALNTYSTNIYDDVIKKYADDATADIKQFISQEVDRTTTAIREKTKTEYHSKISKLFADMESKVKDENSRIEKKIAEDLQSGVKGLLKRMKENIGMLDTLKNQREIKLASPELKTYLEEMLTYVDNNINNLLLKRKPDEAMPQCPAQLLGVRTSLRVLLDGLHGSNHYDHNFAENLDEFEKSLCSLSPKTFANSYAPLLLDAVSDGVKGLAKQLGNAYVSTYSGSSIEWGSKTALLQNGDANLTVEATKCATVCMTVFHTLFNQLHHLFYNSLRSWRKHKINDDGTKRGLKIYLQGQGYEIKNLTTKDYTGWNIAGNLRDAFSKHGEFDQEPESRHADFYSYFVSIIKSKGVVSKLFGCLEKYNKVGHMSTFSSRKHPCSVFEMLGWISGLHYNPVYDKLLAHIDSLIKSETDGELRNVLFDLRGLQIPSMSTPIYDLLVTITGYGDASTYYGCEYLGNNLGLYYPNRGRNALICSLISSVDCLPCSNFCKSSVYSVNQILVGLTAFTAGTSSLPNHNVIVMQIANQKTNQSANLGARQTPNQTADQRLH
ncbi:hypothetical protein, conserved [Babesia ovata]|uniref:Extracellular matrix-binding ebh n=1 Tax=Babesia ovata TaxID=189622 RepID=A0A2H6KJP7_9APIC|nr:uncharacterized protein BOVATA_047010 [Babesia ovata]GBE63208.1 hypothetical protein, conserved [Babesia ovata]